MRIAIVAEVFLPKVDGVVIRTMNLIDELLAGGDDVIVFCPEVEGPRHSPVPIVEFAGFPFPSYPEYRIGIPDQRLPEAIRKFQPDIIHYLNPFAFGFSCYDVLQGAGAEFPTLFSFHTLYAEFVKRYGAMKPLSRVLWRLMRHYHNCAGSNLTVSSTMQDQLTARGFERVRLWPPAVDCRLFDPARNCPDMRDRLTARCDTRPLLLTVSRLAPEKNVELLAEVLKQLPGAVLAVVGDGPHRAALEHRFRHLPAVFVGCLRGEELAKAYASADVFVYASETETMGNVILEAMASGTPVVAPAAGGIPGIVEHEQNGLLFEPGNAAAAAGHVRDVLADPDRWQRLSDAGRESTMRCSWRNSANQVRSHYQLVIASHRHNPRSSLPARAALKSLVAGFQLMSRFTKSETVSAEQPGQSSRGQLPTPTVLNESITR